MLLTIPGMHLDVLSSTALHNQVVFLNFRGSARANYRGPVAIDDIVVPQFELPVLWRGKENVAEATILERTRAMLIDTGVVLTTSRPNAEAFSTVFIANADGKFLPHGPFAGLAERVDIGNRSRSDNAFVFSDSIAPEDVGRDLPRYANEVAFVIVHEIGHLLGFAHDGSHKDSGPLDFVALGKGSRVRANDVIRIRTAPPQLTDTGVRQVAGAMGTVTDDPRAGTLQGISYNWFNVSWDDGKFGWSADVGLDPVTPSTPTNPEPGSTTSPGPMLSGSTVILTWNASIGATSYDLGVLDVAEARLVVDTQTSETSYTVTLAAGKTYRWNVAAMNGTVRSNFTEVRYFRTPASAVPTISITAPNGGEHWPVGNTHTITWDVRGDTSAVYDLSVTYSFDGGSSFSNSVGIVASSSRSLPWTPPAIISPTAIGRIRVQARGAGGALLAEDISDDIFFFNSGNSTPPLEIIDSLLTPNRYSRPGDPMRQVKALVIHYVGNAGSTAQANRNYFDGLKVGVRNNEGEFIYASSHYVVGLQGEILRVVPEDEVAYHAGGKVYTSLAWTMFYDADEDGVWPHDKSIGIETCHPDASGAFNPATEESLVALAADVVKRYGLERNQVLRHFDVTNKACPKYHSENAAAWEALVNRIMVAADVGGTPSIPEVSLMSPASGAAWQVGRKERIEWTVTDNAATISKFTLKMSRSLDGTGYTNIATDLPASARWFEYTPSNTDVTNGATALIWIQAIGANGSVITGDFSSASGFTIVPAADPPPGEVSGCTAAAGNGEVTLSWTNPTDADFAGVRIVRKTGGFPANRDDGVLVHNGGGTSIKDTGLSNGTTYYYSAFSFDAAENFSATGATASATPAAPTTAISLASPAAGAVWQVGRAERVEWSVGDASRISYFQVLLSIGEGEDFLQIDVNLLSSRRSLDYTPGYTKVTSGADAVVRVDAYDAGGQLVGRSSNSGRFTISAPADMTPPGEISGFSAVGGNGHVSLQWTNPNDGDFAGVLIVRKAGGSPTGREDGDGVFEDLGTDFTDTGLTNGTTYYYRAFTYDESANYSTGVTASATPAGIQDTTPPQVAINSPTDNQTVTSATLTVAGTATDNGRGNNGVASVTVNGVSASGGSATGANTANWSATINLVAGANDITVVAKDSRNNTVQQLIQVVYAPPDAPPAVSRFDATPVAVVVGQSTVLSAAASDSDAGDSISDLRFFEGNTLLGSATFSNNQWTFTWSTAGHAAGSFTLRAIAYDKDGTPSEPREAAVTISSVSNQPPGRPANAEPAAGASGVALTATLRGIAYADPDGDAHAASQWVVIRASDGGVVADSQEDSTHLVSWAVPQGCLANSTGYRWKVRYKDSKGAWSEYSAETAFTTVGVAPTLTLSSPNGGATWQVGRSERVSWSLGGDAARLSSVSVLLSTNNGVNYTILASNISSSIFTFDYVPLGSQVTTAAIVWVRASDSAGNPVTGDISDGPFRINAPQQETVAAPVFSPPGGTFSEAVAVSIASNTPGAVVRYTMDGSDPDSYSFLWDQPVTIGTTRTIKARAFLDGMTPSATTTAVFTISQPSISVSNASVVEGNTGKRAMVFQVSLSQPSPRIVTVDYGTFTDDAKSGVDYMATRGTLVFSPGQTVKTVPVMVIADRLVERDETMALAIFNPVNAYVRRETGAGIIRNDDAHQANLKPYAPPKWSGPIVTSAVKKSAINAKTIFSDQSIYVDVAVHNNGAGDVNRPFRYKLLLNGKVKMVWTETDLPKGYYSYITDFSLGRLKPGRYTLKLVVDGEKWVGESNETDNVFTRSIVVKRR